MPINRRDLSLRLLTSALGGWALARPPSGAYAAEAGEIDIRVEALTHGPRHHFFGYYGMPPWNASGSRLVCLESPFQDHLPLPDEPAGVVLVDPKTREVRKVGETRAWNLQQGAMLHWNPVNPDREILFNDRRGNEVLGVVLDVESGKRRWLPRAVNGVSRSGRYALSLTYGRLTRLRPVVGYVGTVDPNPDDPHPANDGVYVMDLETGETKLAVSIAEVYRRLAGRHPELRERHMWFNHTVFNPSATRFFFLARSWTPEKRLETGMFTCNRDGSDLREVIPYGSGVSHFDWRSDREIIATFRHDGEAIRHVLFTDGQADYRVIGEGFLSGDGHCSYAPDGKWLVTDQMNREKLERTLVVMNPDTGARKTAGPFPMRELRYFGGDLRCDLHPRWSRTGDAICFDALEPEHGTRQLHVAYLTLPR